MRDDGLNRKAPAVAYWPVLMADFFAVSPDNRNFVQRNLTYVIRSSRTGSNGFVNDLGTAVWSINPNLPLASVRTLQEIYDASLARTSFTLVMLVIAAAMALILGVVGIYGVISYAVSQRTREIGIRLALGAQGSELKRMFVQNGLMLASAGMAIGLVAAVGLTRLMSSLLYGVSPLDLPTYAAVPIVLAGATVLASYLPARRAAAVDPVEALKAE